MPEYLLSAEGLSYRYDDGTDALVKVDLGIGPGEKVGLIGPNGSGKSTLLLCLGGLLTGRGAVKLDGRPLTRSDFKASRGQIGLIFQSPDDQLFMPTLEEDLAFGPINQGLDEHAAHERVHQVADRMGLDAMLGRAPHHLSMGQKRNAAIAAVLAMKPTILLMDEPSSNLDPRSRRRLIKVLTDLDTAMLIASHDLALVGCLCRRVMLIDEGRMVADGSTTEILGNAELMESHGLEWWTPR
ncbi:MAG TPA: energy-coupling factor ABC transporter ATP-binding protein [Phycisphaerae bacterium]|nr:energy-coupling factor ABC transporter ATP-binding protein [Phycisphaerae bacterium]HRY68795.1 energy-coupling factor ABC transporter ATP-binding protein [Phycisphaerae bacterium]HSA27458.1 energy-coupling factor ABC transporter ATP-binding protein [Phycisphaerae bacterium]